MPPTPNADSLAVRDHLVEALNLDLIGPGANHELAAEQLPGWIRPSNWYLTGFLSPSDTPAEARSDVDEDEDLDTVPEVHGLAEESSEERKAAKKAFFPSSKVRQKFGLTKKAVRNNFELQFMIDKALRTSQPARAVASTRSTKAPAVARSVGPTQKVIGCVNGQL